LGWSIPTLSCLSGASTSTIHFFENGQQEAKSETIAKLLAAFGDAVERVRRGETRIDLVPAQCRGARGLLGWSVPYLAGRSGVDAITIHRYERETQKAKLATVVKLRQALEEGVEFGGDGWLRLRVKS